MHKPKFIFALGLINLAVFILTTLFLPSAGAFSYDNSVSYYLNSRTDWHIAFVVAISTALISWAVYLFIASFQNQKAD